MNFPDTNTPNMVRKYAPIWVKDRRAKQSVEIVDRVFGRFAKVGSVAVFAARQSQVYYQFKDVKSEISTEMIFQVISGQGSSETKVFHQANSLGFVVPFRAGYSEPWKIIVPQEVPLVILQDESRPGKKVFLMPRTIRGAMKEAISQGKDILIDVLETKYKKAHTTIMMFSPSQGRVYYLNPWGSRTVREHEVELYNIQHLFESLFQVKVKGMFHSWDICPYGIQGVEIHKKDKRGLVGLCRLWSLMLMTRYLEYSARGIPMKNMVANLFDPKDPRKHPYLVLSNWMRDLGMRAPYKKRTLKANIQAPRPVTVLYPKTPGPCAPEKMRNPVTRRCISLTGRAYQKLHGGHKPKGPRPGKPGKPCPLEKVRNPLTNRCILKTGRVYRKLLKAGN